MQSAIVATSVSNGSVFGPLVLYWFGENPDLAGSVRVCAKRFPQLSPQIFIQYCSVWDMKYAASAGASFRGL